MIAAEYFQSTLQVAQVTLINITNIYNNTQLEKNDADMSSLHLCRKILVKII